MDSILNRTETKVDFFWDSARGSYPHSRVDELFELTAQERADDPAITFLDTTLSYASFCTMTHRLAARLQRLGVRRGTIVGICMDRCTEMVMALLAALKT